MPPSQIPILNPVIELNWYRRNIYLRTYQQYWLTIPVELPESGLNLEFGTNFTLIETNLTSGKTIVGRNK